MPVELQVLSIFAVANGYTDKLEVAQVRPFEEALHRHMLSTESGLMNDLRVKAELDKDVTDRLKKAIGSFVEKFIAGTATSVSGSTNGAGHGAQAQKSAPAHATAA